MSARKLATGCALAVFMLAAAAEAAPRATVKAARRGTTPPAKVASVATPAPAPAPTPAPAPAPALAPPVADADQPASSPSTLRHRATITLNPLALVVGRYGANAEFVFAPHHAITFSGYLQTFPTSLLHTVLPDIALPEAPQSRLGGELGYRLYSGSDGPTGVFIGPSFVAMPLAAPRLTDDYRAEVVSFMAYGASLDIGVQAVVSPGFTIGGGVGVMALAYSTPASATPPAGIALPAYPEPHILPRLLVMAGWAF